MQANTRSNAERFDLEVRKLQSLCALHNIPIGNPKDLAGFMRQLAADRHFAMEFWAFIGTLSGKEKGELTDDQMLSVILEGVVGGDIPEDDWSLNGLVSDLANLLAGIDVPNPTIGHDFELPPTPYAGPAPQNEPANVEQVHVDQIEAEQFVANLANREVQSPPRPSDPASPPGMFVESVDSKPSPPSETALEAEAAFERLELKNRELQHYIDEIEARLKRIEPRLEEHIAASKVRIIATGAEGAQKAIEELEHEHKPVGCVRLVLDPDLSTDADTFDMEQADLAERIPLANYPQRDGHGRVVLFLLLLVLLAGSLLFAQRRGMSLRGMYASLVQKIQAVGARGNVGSPSQSAPKEAVATPQSSSVVPNSAVNSTNPQPAATPASPTPVAASNADSNATVAKVQPPAATSNQTRVPSGVSNPPAGAKVLSGRSAFVPTSSYDEVVKPIDRETKADDEANAVRVAPAIMASNLFISRVPIYPEAARVNRVEGRVVAQTIIGKDGTVEQVHVISGDPHLRDAAIAAIEKWRYRPYLLNGRPAPVETTVTVDFRLNR